MDYLQKILYGLLVLVFITGCTTQEKTTTPRWYKGNLHTHSYWSDGDDYPEMIMDWYHKNGYQFTVLSDHNILQQGEKWYPIGTDSLRNAVLERCRQRFGADWVQTRGQDSTLEVKLKTLAEYRDSFEVPGTFLIIQSEEISDGYENKPIHLNATNVKELIQPQGGSSVVEVIQNNIDAVLAQREATGQPMFPHINHPNFGWAITADDMRKLTGERFFEVYNGHPLVNNYGDSNRLGTEEIWDIINADYIQNDKPVMYGLATDDSHNYHRKGLRFSNLGRGWVMVQTENLTPAALIEAMEAGRFYASTGVSLDQYSFENNQLSVAVAAEAGVTYTIQFWGVPKGELDGKLLEEVSGTNATYTLPEDILFVRGKVISSKLQENPYKTGDRETAWGQPVGALVK